MTATATTAVLHNNDNDKDMKEPLELFDTDESVSKLTVATAPLTPTMDLPTKTGYNASRPEVARSSSTLSSCHGDNNNKDQHYNNEEDHDDYQIPHTCSSPYFSEAFQFSSEWLNGRGELTLPEMKPNSGAAEEGGGEDESQASGGYFEPVDLDSSHWTQAMNINGATFGFAIVALATALMHPFLFVAGALTAFGTMQAVGAGYEYCSNGNTSSSSDHTLCSSISNNNNNSAWEQCLMLLCHKDLPADTTSTSGDETAIIKAPEDTETTMDTIDNNNNNNKEVNDSGVLSNSVEVVVPVTGGNKSNVMTPATALATLAQSSTVITQTQTTEATKVKSKQQEQEDETQLNQQQMTPIAKQQQITMELLHQTYPQLENRVVEDVSFPGLNAIEFFRVFFADDAPYNFKALQEKRGDLDIVYGHWDELDPTQDRLSLHHDVTTPTTIPLQECRYKSFLGRVLTFKAKTNNFIGPVYACTRKTQKVLLAHKTLVVMESRTDLSEIPFCDKFYVLERWIISAEKVDGKYISNLTATSQVIFTQSCQFASQIKSKSASTIQDLVKCWCVMAKEALKLTEESKKQRLQQQEEEDEDDSDLEDDEDLSNKESEAYKENVPPTDDEEEGVEVTWPENEAPFEAGEPKETVSKSTRSRSSSLRRPRILKHSDSAPFPSHNRDRPKPLQGFRRSVSHLWGKR